MPSLPGASCRIPGCREKASQKNSGFCEKHKGVSWKRYQESKGGQANRVYATTFWKKLRQLCINRAMGLCENCARDGIVKPGVDVDHITPIEKGGKDELSNLQLLCKDCHKAKTARE